MVPFWNGEATVETNNSLPEVANPSRLPVMLYGDPETVLTFWELSTRMP